MANSGDAKESFYQDLKSLSDAVPSSDKRIILSDFIVKVGTYSASWEGEMGTKGTSCNICCKKIALCCWKPLLHLGSSSPTPSFFHPSQQDLMDAFSHKGTGMMSESLRLCVVQNAGWTTD